MDNSKTSQRRNFRCVFNGYVSEYNRDAIIQSIISQFNGYFADPEVTLIDKGFILSINIGENLSASMVRDKILWNQFVESVTAADAIRKIQIIRLPKASTEGKVDIDGLGEDTGVDEKLNVPLTYNSQYTIGPNQDGSLGWHASVHYADPTGELLPSIYGPGAEDGEPVDEDIKPGLTDPHADPNTTLDSGKNDQERLAPLFSFKVISMGGEGSAFSDIGQQNQYGISMDAPNVTLRPDVDAKDRLVSDQAMIPGGNFFNYTKQQGTTPGFEKQLGDSTEGLLTGFDDKSLGTKSNKQDPTIANEEELDPNHDIRGEYGSTLDMLHVGDDPIGGASYGSYFGLNETYDYQGDIDEYGI